MKKIVAAFLSLCLVMAALPVCRISGCAESGISGDEFRYREQPDGTLIITGYSGNETSLVIPAEINGTAVSAIGESAFEDNTDLQTLELPGSVLEIGDYAFCGCTALNGVSFGEGLQSVGSGAFADCESLGSITLPSSLNTIGSYAFARCHSLVEAVLQNKDTEIGKDAFPDATVVSFASIGGVTDTDEEDSSETDEPEKRSFLSLGDVWGLSFDEIAAQYPGHIIYKEARIYNHDMSDPADLCIRAKRYLPLGWTKYGGLMVLCENYEKDDSYSWPDEPSIGYIQATYERSGKVPVAVEDYPACIPDQPTAFPEQFSYLQAVALQEITEIRYSRGYYFNITISEGEKLNYLATVDTPEGKYDYVIATTRGLGDRAYLTPLVMIPHGMIKLEIPLQECEVNLLRERYSYTQEIVYPEVEVTFRGYVLTEGEDYQIISDSIDPGPANARITGMGYFAGEKPVNYTICLTEVKLEPVEDIVIGDTILLKAEIKTAEDQEDLIGIPSEDNVSWDLKGVYQTAEWMEQNVEKADDSYFLERTMIPDHPGKYKVYVEYDGVRASREFIVEPKISYSAGPLLEDGTLAEGHNRNIISSYTDIRILTEYDEKNLLFLRDFLMDLTEDQPLVSEFNLEIDQKRVVADAQREQVYLVLRVKPVLAENEGNPAMYAGWFKLTTPAEQHLNAEVQASNGILAEFTYRSELTKDEKIITDSWNKSVEKAGTEEPANEKRPGAQSRTHLFYFDDQYFYSSADVYDNSLAVMSLGLELASWSPPDSDRRYKDVLEQNIRAANLIDAFEQLHMLDYSLFKFDQPLNVIEDDTAFGIGIKYISSQYTDDTLIVVVVRGGGYGAEWASNFHVGNNGNHIGFSDSAKFISGELDNYVRTLAEQGRIIGKLKIWVIGYSRGAAVANLLGKMISESGSVGDVSCSTCNMFIYTFATPAGWRDRRSKTYSNIHNVISSNDLVPKMAPAAWGFRRAGTDVLLPEMTPQTVEDAFYRFRDEELHVSNIGWIEDAIIAALVSFYPDTEHFTRMAEKIIMWRQQVEFQNPDGSFVKALGLGLIRSLFADLGDAIINQSFAQNFMTLFFLTVDIATLGTGGGFFKAWKEKGLKNAVVDEMSDIGRDAIKDSLIDTTELGVITSRIDDAKGAILLSMSESILKQLIDDEEQGFPRADLSSMNKAHYPEHYLAWLETGGEVSVIGSRSFALKTNEERDLINELVRRWIQSK